MADSEGIGSTNPVEANETSEKLYGHSNTVTNLQERTERDRVGETSHVNASAVAPIHTGLNNTGNGKRKRSSTLDENQRETNEQQSDSTQNNEESNGAAPFSLYQGGHDSNFVAVELLHQQQEAAQRNSQMLQAQLEGLYRIPSAQSYVSPNTSSLIIANQLRQAEMHASFLRAPPGQSNNELQQLSALLQQHLYGVGLAQTLGINLQSSREAMGGSAANTNPSISLPSSQLRQGFVSNSDAFPVSLHGTNNTNSTSDISPSLHQTNESVLAPINHAFETRSETGRPQHNGTTGSSGLSGRPPIQLYISCDDDSLSEYQCLVRKHIELFEAGVEDVESNAQGRNRPIILGQVGIRCRHCTMLPPRHRSRGAIYYPAKLQGIYQAAQNLAVSHLGEHCQNVPDDIRSTLIKLRERKSSAGGGKRYWANGVRVLGVQEDHDGLRFESRLGQNDSVI